MSITDKIKQFSIAYKAEVNQKLSSQMISHKLLVNELPDELKSVLQPGNRNLTIKGSIGQGNTTFYPWLGIFDRRVSTGATNGFYVVLLFSDDFEDLYLTLNQGSTIQSQKQIEHYRTYVYGKYSRIPGFEKGHIPLKGLVKTKGYTTNNKGRKYEETNIFYKKFVINELNDASFLSDLEHILNVYVECANGYINSEKTTDSFKAIGFYSSTVSAKLKYNKLLVARFISALITKPFVILTGLSGSGKTKLAQAFAQWICADVSQFKIIPVGADWTNREPLLGFPSALEPGKYVKSDNGTLDLILEASKPENVDRPYFLILDEMNLSHVERYFADFLSAMESGEAIPLHPDTYEWKDTNGKWKDNIPNQFMLPRNFFILGTVNIDETTYMFSPKVLDRAGVIEFRINEEEMTGFMAEPLKPD